MKTDQFPTRVVVVALALVVVGGLAALVFLASTQTPIPDSLDRLVFAALGAISALLAKTSHLSGGDPAQVEVVNAPGDPVPVVGEHDPL
jgi:hypothetical protein